MTDQTESEYERIAAMLEKLAHGDGPANPLGDGARAIRALEAKAAAWERDALMYAQNSEFHHGQCVIARADRDRLDLEYARLTLDRDRIAAELRGTQTRMSEIAGEVFNLRADVMQWQVYFKTMVEFSAHNHARLTSELAAARDEIASMRSNAQDIKAAIREAEHGDAARSAGGGG